VSESIPKDTLKLTSPSLDIVEDVSIDEVLTVQQIAARWKLSPDKVRRIFAHEAGVLVFGNESSHGNKRSYSTMRIPRDVLLRVERRYSLKAQLPAKDR
jgi:hypothetical protein